MPIGKIIDNPALVTGLAKKISSLFIICSILPLKNYEKGKF